MIGSSGKPRLVCIVNRPVISRQVDGTLDVRLLRVSDSTICIGVARGGGRGGLDGLAPASMWAADALFLCGS